MECHFCNHDVDRFENQFDISPKLYHCPVCGNVKMTGEAADDFEGENFKDEEKNIISISVRNDYENRGRKPPEKPLSLNDLHQYIKQYVPLDPLEKINNALLILDKASRTKGQKIIVPVEVNFPYYHCHDSEELESILGLIEQEGYIFVSGGAPNEEVWITAKGYEKLREIKKLRIDSKKCFVAMWFNPVEMGRVYEKAIKPAIEYREDDSSEPRFKAIKIDNVEHVNDINDEIIATIRRSRFMVCDLTGYRGGVYFEAGFAYGLGLPVIYTCRKDWTKEQILRSKDRKKIKELYDENMKPLRVRKEGVHFDLAHRNRVEWEEDKLDEFKVKLENRIKAVII